MKIHRLEISRVSVRNAVNDDRCWHDVNEDNCKNQARLRFYDIELNDVDLGNSDVEYENYVIRCTNARGVQLKKDPY